MLNVDRTRDREACTATLTQSLPNPFSAQFANWRSSGRIFEGVELLTFVGKQ